MGTGLLRRHRDALAKLREQEAEQEIVEVVTSTPVEESTVDEPEVAVDDSAQVADKTPTSTKRKKAK